MIQSLTHTQHTPSMSYVHMVHQCTRNTVPGMGFHMHNKISLKGRRGFSPILAQLHNFTVFSHSCVSQMSLARHTVGHIPVYVGGVEKWNKREGSQLSTRIKSASRIKTIHRIVNIGAAPFYILVMTNDFGQGKQGASGIRECVAQCHGCRVNECCHKNTPFSHAYCCSSEVLYIIERTTGAFRQHQLRTFSVAPS